MTGDGQTQQNALRLRLSDAVVTLTAVDAIDIQGIAALGVYGPDDQPTNNLDAHGFYSEIAGVRMVADGGVSVENTGRDVITESDSSTENTASQFIPEPSKPHRLRLT